MCLRVNRRVDLPAGGGGGAALFGRQRVVGSGRSRQLFVKVLNLLLVHLHHHRTLQLHGRTCGTSTGFILLNTSGAVAPPSAWLQLKAKICVVWIKNDMSSETVVTVIMSF